MACEKCQTGLILSRGLCLSRCLTTEFVARGACQLCKEPCRSCVSESQCLSCKYKNLYQGECVAFCPALTFASDNVCKTCAARCLSCYSFTSCMTCQSGYSVVQGICMHSCYSVNCQQCANAN
jgi:hypothetical protein